MARPARRIPGRGWTDRSHRPPSPHRDRSSRFFREQLVPCVFVAAIETAAWQYIERKKWVKSGGKESTASLFWCSAFGTEHLPNADLGFHSRRNLRGGLPLVTDAIAETAPE